ncbi:MAG: permease protein putative transport system permease protein [Candidatus Saccharibacteria bacterium]|nr:permease protein putative transport system permease protein [Candidatus Saccharibacteria bacterium]
MKFLDILGSASSNMLRSKVRTILTITAIFIGAFTITLTVGISSGVSSYIDKQLGNIGAENVLLIRPKVDLDTGSGPKKYDPEHTVNSAAQARSGNVTLTSKDIEKIKTQDGIKDVQPIIAAVPDYIQNGSGDKYQISTQSFIDGSRFDLASGKLPDNSAIQPEVLLPVSFVSPLGFSSNESAVGQTVTFAIKTSLGKQEMVSAKISGVQQQSLLSDAGGASANKKLISELTAIQTRGLPADTANKYPAASAQLASGISDSQLQMIKDGLKSKGYQALTVADQIGIIKQVIDAITYVLIFFGAIALLAASFGIINTLYMSVQERTKEIGLMKAMGMSRSKVFLLFSVEAILLGFWGSGIGALAAIGAGQLVNKIASAGFLKDLPGFSLTEFPILSIASIMLLIMTIAFLAGTLPARRAAKQDPIDALRYE